MKSQRRRLAVVVSLVTAVVAAAGVTVMGASATTAGYSPNGGLPNPLIKGNYSLTVYADQNWVLPAEKTLAAKFKKLTGITVNYDIVPDSTYQSLLQTKLSSGQQPGDIYMGQPPGGTGSGLQTEFEVTKHAVDLSSQPWVKREFAITRSMVTYKGKLYGQTIWDTISGSWVLVYNRSAFSKAGITSPPTTFAQLTAACAKLKAAGINPIYEPVSDGWHQVLWFPENMTKAEANSPGLVKSLNNNKATFAGTSLAVTAMTQINSLYKAGYFGPTALTDTFANSVPKMASGEYAMSIQNLSFPTGVNAANPSIPVSAFGFMPVPILDNQFINQNPGGPTKFVYKQGKHVAAALEYLDFLATQKNLQYYIKASPTVVTLPWQGVTGKWNPVQLAFEKKYKPSPSPVFQVSVNYVNPQWSQIGTDIAAMFTGQESPTQVLQNIDQRRAQEAHAAGDPHWRS